MVLKLRDAPKILPFMEEESIIVDELTSFVSNIRKRKFVLC